MPRIYEFLLKLRLFCEILQKNSQKGHKMFHICFNADENYIKYTAVLITSIVKSTDTSKSFKDFFDNASTDTFANATKADTLATRERERERE